MTPKDDFNITLPIILIGILAVCALLFFTLFDRGSIVPPEGENNTPSSTVKRYHFTAPNQVAQGAMALFSWKANVSESAECEGNSVPEGSDGGWSGPKSVEGEQEVGPIDKNTTYFLDCFEGEDASRDMELVTVLESRILLTHEEDTDGSHITWSSLHVESCALTNQDEEILSTETNGILKATAEATYTLTCKTSKGSLTESLSVNE